MNNVLVAGGTGLIGSYLIPELIKNGFSVKYLSRKANHNSKGVSSYYWNPAKDEIDLEALEWADHIINLAGETVGQRWTEKKKAEILQSRIDCNYVLSNHLPDKTTKLKSYISASAIGLYGINTQDELITEESKSGDGYLAEVVEKWEEAIDSLASYSERVVKLRTGIVLTKSGGALEKMATPIKFGLGAALGSGEQWMSWIHISDLVNMYLYALKNSISGVYNAVAPSPAQNRDFSKQLAKVLNKPFFLPNVPAFALKIILGEMSVIVLGGNKVLPMAFQKEGFKFEHASLTEALTDLLVTKDKI